MEARIDSKKTEEIEKITSELKAKGFDIEVLQSQTFADSTEIKVMNLSGGNEVDAVMICMQNGCGSFTR